jgi:hypothetical protein
MLSKQHIINERTQIIPIKQNLSTTIKNNSPKGEYSLKKNFFDPSKHSPPNNFMIKLNMRMSVYTNSYADINDDNFDKE